MNKIELIGQIITSTNYATKQLFNFTPDLVVKGAENFLASGISKIEVPQGVLDPENRSSSGCDENSVKMTVAGLPRDTSVVGTYLGNDKLGSDNRAYLESQKRSLNFMMEYFPDMSYAMLHPAEREFGRHDDIQKVVETYLELANYASSQRPGFQLCFHNHYDSNGETADQVRTYLAAIDEAGLPAMRWGVDTAQSDGMGKEHLAVLSEYAHLIGNYFHIKARIPSFDSEHENEKYDKERDIWGGLYCGAVNPADPEITTPFEDIFTLIRKKARPTGGTVYGALEIDNPRQHPRLEVMCGALYLRKRHGVKSSMALSNDEIIDRVFQ